MLKERDGLKGVITEDLDLSGDSFAQQKQWCLPLITPVLWSAASTSPAEMLIGPMILL